MDTETFPWDAYDTDCGEDIAYLLSDAAQSRYVLAAHYLRDCDHIVEIGGYKTPITKFLTRVPKSVLVLDPQGDDYQADTLYGEPCTVRHFTQRYQDYDFALKPGDYGLVILGVSLKFFSKDEAVRAAEWKQMLGLIDDASVAVIEYPIGWERGTDNVGQMLRQAKVTVKMTVDMHLEKNADMHPVYNKRRFMVLVPKGR